SEALRVRGCRAAGGARRDLSAESARRRTTARRRGPDEAAADWRRTRPADDSAGLLRSTARRRGGRVLRGAATRYATGAAPGRTPGVVPDRAQTAFRQMKLLLDTCTFLWIVTGSPRLSARVRDLFRAPEQEVFLSAASAWEIAVKHGLGRLTLPEP